jgi:tripartite-type tricarboxylate transporter receptor subunit TctC
MKSLLKLLMLLSLLWLPAQADAQPYPSKIIRLVVPFPPGGAGDMHARLVAQHLPALLGQTVIVENRAGASGNIGADYVAKAAPDGYTLLFATTNLVLNQALGQKLPFNVTTDFAPITMTLTAQNLLTIRRGLPFSDVKGLIAHAKANPGKLTYGSSGVGTPWLSMEMLKSMAGVDILHVPYKGDGPAIADVLGGQIDMYATNVSALDSYHRSGQVHGIAVTSKKRATSLPDVPTMEEAGVPGYELETWFGFLAPAATPKEIVDKVNAAFVRVVTLPDVQKSMTDLGLTPVTMTPAEFGVRIQNDIRKFGEIAKNASAKPE